MTTSPDRAGLREREEATAARKYFEHRQAIAPFVKDAPPPHYAADSCLREFMQAMKKASRP